MLRSWHVILVVLLLLLLAAAVERAGLIQPWLLASAPALAARLTLRQLLHRALGCCSAGGCLCPLALAGSLLQTAKHK